MGVTHWGGGGEASCPSHVIDIPLGCEPHVDGLLAPRALEKGTIRCRVRRIERARLELFVESGYGFVLSAVHRGRDWLISDRPLCKGDTQSHIAVLRDHKDGTFTCIRARVGASIASRKDPCSGQREILFVRHITKEVDEYLPALNVINACMPLTEPDEYSMLHPWEKSRLNIPFPQPLPARDCPPGELAMQNRLAVDGKRRAADGVAVVVTRLPKWNTRSQARLSATECDTPRKYTSRTPPTHVHGTPILMSTLAGSARALIGWLRSAQTYELPFIGRANWASARNFQLVEQVVRVSCDGCGNYRHCGSGRGDESVCLTTMTGRPPLFRRLLLANVSSCYMAKWKRTSSPWTSHIRCHFCMPLP